MTAGGHWRRRAAAGLPALLVLLGAQLGAQIGPQPAAASAPSRVAPGQAIATASVAGFVPILSNATLAVSVGDAVARYEGDEARASAAAVDLGGLGAVLANTDLCGQPELPARDQPQPLVADSTHGPTTLHGGLPGAFAETVDVVPPDTADASVDPVGEGLGSAVSFQGQAASSVTFEPRGVRSAEARVVATLDLGGIVQLVGMRWQASDETGAQRAAAASFTVGAVRVAGMTLPTATEAELATAVRTANAVLRPALGLTLVLPVVRVEPDRGQASVGPLSLALGPSALAAPVFGPVDRQVLGPLQTALSGLGQAGSDCADASVLLGNLESAAETPLGVALAVFSGSGGVDVDLGGASVATAAPPSYTNPFGAAGTQGAGVPPAGSSSQASSPPGAGGAGVSAGGAGARAIGELGQGSLPPAALGAPSGLRALGGIGKAGGRTEPPRVGSVGVSAGLLRCESASPAHAPSCSAGDATVVGAVVVGLGAGLGAVDVLRERRMRRRRAAPAAGEAAA